MYMSFAFQPSGLSSGSLQHAEFLKTEVVTWHYVSKVNIIVCDGRIQLQNRMLRFSIMEVGMVLGCKYVNKFCMKQCFICLCCMIRCSVIHI